MTSTHLEHMCTCGTRFLVETRHDGTVCLDIDEEELFNIPHPLLRAVPYVLYIVSRDPSAGVEVYTTGEGLAMAGLLKAHGVEVVSSHCWPDE
jgi:hypothetical protein